MPRTVLLQLDADPHPSVFDRIVALDAGADEVLAYGGVTPAATPALIHGAIFTRKAKELHRTAVFIGGRDADLAAEILATARAHLLPQFGLQVSLMIDPNGANTTAAAALHLASRHLDWSGKQVLVLGTGPVGRRVASLTARRGARVRIGAVNLQEAAAAAAVVLAACPSAQVDTAVTATLAAMEQALAGSTAVFSAGPPGKLLLPRQLWQAAGPRVIVDFNAVPPAGVEDVAVHEAGEERDGCYRYGALGVGGLKMKLHQAAIGRLFTRSDLVLDDEALLGLAAELA